jgi:transcription antitermination factor NusG
MEASLALSRQPPPEEAHVTASSPSVPLPWYALKVRNGGEALVNTVLRNKSYETFLPAHTEARAYSDRVKKVAVPLFPGYLFCRLDATRRVPVLTTNGVAYIVSVENRPAPIPEEEVSAILQVVRSGRDAKPWPYLKSGDRVRVVFGSMAGVEGILVSEKGADRLLVSVEILQRSVSVDIDRSWIRPL